MGVRKTALPHRVVVKIKRINTCIVKFLEQSLAYNKYSINASYNENQERHTDIFIKLAQINR